MRVLVSFREREKKWSAIHIGGGGGGWGWVSEGPGREGGWET